MELTERLARRESLWSPSTTGLIFGFLAHPERLRKPRLPNQLRTPGPDLRFTVVKRNIAAFGGDPNNILLVGSRQEVEVYRFF